MTIAAGAAAVAILGAIAFVARDRIAETWWIYTHPGEVSLFGRTFRATAFSFCVLLGDRQDPGAMRWMQRELAAAIRALPDDGDLSIVVTDG